MSWLNQLYETYERCKDVPEFFAAKNPLLPICHTYQNAHIEVTLSGAGDFRRARVLSKDELTTIVPCSEASGGRSGSKPVNHPLCDKLQYLAGDYLDFGGIVTTGFKKNPQEPHQNYMDQLEKWLKSENSHPKLDTIFNYLKKNQLIADLVKEKILLLDEDRKLIKKWQGDNDKKTTIFKIMPTGQPPENALIRWKVEKFDEELSETWKDRDLMDAWINYYTTRDALKGFCMASGEDAVLAEMHPSGLRHGADKAKLISANDKIGYTFRGRFTDKTGRQACTISAEITQKAHNTLRWLIQRKQAYRYGDQVFITWVTSVDEIPSPLENTYQALGLSLTEDVQNIGETGQAFATKFAKQIAGYKANLGSPEKVTIMGLDSATPGRMAITYYKELAGSDFFERIKYWHETVCWHQNYSQKIKFIGAPSPKDIAEAAYGQRIDDKLRKATVERLLPCIIDGIPIPQDLINSAYHRLCNRVGMDAWEWEKTLGILCALLKGSQLDRKHQMALETEQTSRDYLYGRLLAVADYLEYSALRIESSKNKTDRIRPTSATRLMHQFSMHPYKTWKNISDSLIPYKPKIPSTLLTKLEKITDEIMDKFSRDDFIDPKPLSSEFLLAFHCQRKALWTKKETTTKESGA